MQDMLSALGPWAWWIAAAVLLFMELVAPGVFLMWLAFAAASVGIIDYFTDLSWQIETALFAAFSIAFVYVARPFYSKSKLPSSDQPNLNQRIYGFVGNTYTLTEAITDGQGKLNIDGARWDLLGPDLAAGTHVRVTAVEGMKLRVGKA